jgi:hypothetical protein
MSPSRALTLQTLAGVLNAWVWGAVVWAVGTSVPTAIDPLCGAVGWLGCLLLPFGALEIAWSVHARSGPDPARASQQLAKVQLLGVLLGSLPSLVVGGMVLRAGGTPPR